MFPHTGAVSLPGVYLSLFLSPTHTHKSKQQAQTQLDSLTDTHHCTGVSTHAHAHSPFLISTGYFTDTSVQSVYSVASGMN